MTILHAVPSPDARAGSRVNGPLGPSETMAAGTDSERYAAVIRSTGSSPRPWRVIPRE